MLVEMYYYNFLHMDLVVEVEHKDNIPCSLQPALALVCYNLHITRHRNLHRLIRQNRILHSLVLGIYYTVNISVDMVMELEAEEAV